MFFGKIRIKRLFTKFNVLYGLPIEEKVNTKWGKVKLFLLSSLQTTRPVWRLVSYLSIWIDIKLVCMDSPYGNNR